MPAQLTTTRSGAPTDAATATAARTDSASLTSVRAKTAADLVGQRLAALLVQVGDDDLAACRGKFADRRFAEAASPSGHDCGGSVEFHGRSILRSASPDRTGFG